MKKKWVIPIMTALTIGCTVLTPAQHIYAGDDVEKVVSYDENGRKVITLIFDPEKMPEEVKKQLGLCDSEVQQETNKISPEYTKDFIPTNKLTAAPKEGEVLGKILYTDATGKVKYTSPYYTYAFGQCTWYARGRFHEVHEIPVFINGDAKTWLDRTRWNNTIRWNDKIKVVTDIEAVPEQSIAVYVPKKDDSLKGHVCFIEYVERDKYGKPLYIYYTDANGKKDTKKNAYTPGVDGMVIKENFEKFKENSHLKLAGYIAIEESI